MISALLAALAFTLAADPLTTRIGESNAAAEALQGPLDGAWTLRDGAERVLYVFQMSDPPGSKGVAHGACRDGAGAIGQAEFTLIVRNVLRVRIEGAASGITFTESGGVWRGRRLGAYGAVILTHGLAASRPPV